MGKLNPDKSTGHFNPSLKFGCTTDKGSSDLKVCTFVVMQVHVSNAWMDKWKDRHGTLNSRSGM